MTATQRITLHVSAHQKAHIAAQAKTAGLKTGEFLRRAAEAYVPTADSLLMEDMIEEMVKSTQRASAAIDEALSFIEESNQRIAALEVNAPHRAA